MEPLLASFQKFKVFFQREKSLNFALLQKLRPFKARVLFEIDCGDYLVKTASCYEDLLPSFQLRQASFLDGKFNAPLTYDHLEIDRYDLIADHILIIEKKSTKLIGTYRVINSLFSRSFYSQTEFHLEDFLKTPFVKMELGRACIHPDYRNGRTIDLLWKGIGKYVELTKPRYLFGCSSIKSTDPQKTQLILSYLNQKSYISSEFHVIPTDAYKLNFPVIVHPQKNPLEDPKRMIPPLLRSYLNAGAEIHGFPALDLEFGTVDFLTILDLEEINPAFLKRYFQAKNPSFSGDANA